MESWHPLAERKAPRIDPPRFQLRLNCPMCGEKLTYIQTEGDVKVYHCASDGVVLLPPDGQVRVVIH